MNVQRDEDGTGSPGKDRMDGDAAVSDVQRSRRIGLVLYWLAGVVACASIAVGVMLMLHTVDSCHVGSGNDGILYGGACSSNAHPRIGIGLVVLVGGLLQSVTLGLLGRLYRPASH